LQRRREKLRADRFRQHESVRGETRLGEQPDRVVDARVQKRLAHLVKPFQLEAEAVNLALGFLDELPRHVFVRTAQHRQRTHPAAEVALRSELESELEAAKVHGRVSNCVKTLAYSCHEYFRAQPAAARSIDSRSPRAKKASIAFATASGSSGGISIPFFPSLMTSGNPPTVDAITGRAKWNAASATPLCASMRYGARTTSVAA